MLLSSLDAVKQVLTILLGVFLMALPRLRRPQSIVLVVLLENITQCNHLHCGVLDIVSPSLCSCAIDVFAVEVA